MIFLKNKINYLIEVYSKKLLKGNSLSSHEAEMIWKKYDDSVF